LKHSVLDSIKATVVKSRCAHAVQIIRHELTTSDKCGLIWDYCRLHVAVTCASDMSLKWALNVRFISHACMRQSRVQKLDCIRQFLTRAKPWWLAIALPLYRVLYVEAIIYVSPV